MGSCRVSNPIQHEPPPISEDLRLRCADPEDVQPESALRYFPKRVTHHRCESLDLQEVNMRPKVCFWLD
jgi:hypothetical protein